jgi:hypothetical protein
VVFGAKLEVVVPLAIVGSAIEALIDLDVEVLELSSVGVDVVTASGPLMIEEPSRVDDEDENEEELDVEELEDDVPFELADELLDRLPLLELELEDSVLVSTTIRHAARIWQTHEIPQAQETTTRSRKHSSSYQIQP